jgi:hypothetical protein
VTETASYRYWAFISYSSTDQRFARWLHRAIETYEIPARLVGGQTPCGEPAPARLHPCFRDRADLPASSELDGQIVEALRGSRWLIVVCSTRAAKSIWVNKEVEAFLAMGRADRVLAVIVNGQPGGGDDLECLPEALRRAPPIAADVRRAADGRGDAKLKLISGMLGTGLDTLKQRESQRRIRQLQIAFGFALVLAAGFAGLAQYAERQRVRAVDARHQAEGILEYLSSTCATNWSRRAASTS